MIVLLALHAVVGLTAIAFGARLGRRALALGGLPPLVALLWVSARAPGVIDGQPVNETFSWVGQLDLSLDFRLDGFALLMALLVSGIGVVIFAYSMRYFSHATPTTGRLAGLLTLFAGSMLGLVLADNLLLLYVCWELTSITSYLLIGNDHTDPSARAAALQALLTTSAGGLVMFVGFVMLGQAAGTFQLSAIVSSPPTGALVTWALVFIVIGAFTKSAQYPFHSWLPGAMAAPTPVSAYLHSATMVKAGVYLVARLAPAFASYAPWRPLVVGVGLATMVLGGLRALRQFDLKLLLAFGTVSQLGFLVVLFGFGTPEVTTAACVMLLAHALFKAALFMVVGVIDHETGTRDIRRLPHLGHGWRATKVVTALALLSMSGIVPLLGFVGKEAAYDGLLESDTAGWVAALTGVVVGSMLTIAYSVRFWRGAFGARSGELDGVDDVRPPHAPAISFLAPAGVLALASLIFGVLPMLLDDLIDAAAAALDPAVHGVHLALWHGVNAALVLSVVTIAGGVVLAVLRQRVSRLLGRGARIPSADGAYLGFLHGLNRTAKTVTGIVQNGSLPVYAGVTILTAAAVPGATLLIWGAWPELPDWVDAPAHVPIVALLLGSALGAAVVRRRVTAALFLGMVGYSMAGLFVVQGAPDLALTQTAIETLSTVLFVLVLRRLPDRFERTPVRTAPVVRGAIAFVVATTVFAFALFAGGAGGGSAVSDEMVARALPDGHGRNVVNVILVDFRGLDTLGEITVLTAAAIGAVALARADRRRGDVARRAPEQPRQPALTRLVFIDVSVRVMFPFVMIASLWLLFAGHNQPGGGFAGGLLAGAAISLRYIAGGIREVRRHSRFRPWIVLGTGLLLAAAAATAPLLLGDAVLEAGYKSVDVPLLGHVSLTSSLVFDIGVYVLVVGLILMVFEAFGDAPARAAPAAGSVPSETSDRAAEVPS